MTRRRTSSVSDNSCEEKFRQTFGKTDDKTEPCVQCDSCLVWFPFTSNGMNRIQQKNHLENHQKCLVLWCCGKCFVTVKSTIKSGIHKLRTQMQQAAEFKTNSAKKTKDTSNEQQPTVTEMQSVKSEMNALNGISNNVKKTTAAMVNKMAAVAETIRKNLNKNKTCAKVRMIKQVVEEKENSKIHQRKFQRNTKHIGILTNSDTSILENSQQKKLL